MRYLILSLAVLAPPFVAPRFASGLPDSRAAQATDPLPEARPEITQGELSHHLATLAADALAGRQVGTEGGARAADYLARALERAGLQGGGPAGSFGQPIPASRIEHLGPPRLLMRRNTGELDEGQLGVDFTLQITGELNSTGDCAIVKLSTEDDIHQEPSAQGAALLRISMTERSIVARLRKLSRSPAWGMRLELAEEDAPPSAALELPSSLRIGPQVEEGCEVVTVYGEMRDRLLWRGYRSVQLVANAKETAVPVGNVVGWLPGSDAALAGQAILLHAAYDLGERSNARPRGEDTLRNGAEAAGNCAVLLELATLLAADPPARPVVFLFTTATEHQRLGLTEFLNSPPIPLDRFALGVTLERLHRPSADDASGVLLWMAGRDSALADEFRRAGTAEGVFGIRGSGTKDPRPPSLVNRILGKAGVPSLTIECGAPNRRLDAFEDEADGVDLAHLQRVAQELAFVIRKAASGSLDLSER